MVKRILINLALLLVLVFPLWYGLLELFAQIEEGPPRGADWLSTVAFYFLVFAPQLLIGGVVQQAVLLGVPPHWSSGRQRVAAIASTFVVPGVLVLFGGWLRFVLTMIPALLVYGLVLRLPRSSRLGEPSP